jgi:hypothetical protein
VTRRERSHTRMERRLARARCPSGSAIGGYAGTRSCGTGALPLGRLWPSACRSPAPIRRPPRGPAPRTRCATAPRAVRCGEHCESTPPQPAVDAKCQASGGGHTGRGPSVLRVEGRLARVMRRPGDDSPGTDRHPPRRRSDRPITGPARIGCPPEPLPHGRG